MDQLASPDAASRPHDRPIEESPYWAEGQTLIVRKGATLPERCVLCNDPAETYVKKRFRWHSPWMYLLILGGLLLYLIAAGILSRRMKLRLPVCSRHATRHRRGIRLQYVGLALIGAGFLALLVSNDSRTDWPFDPSGYLALLILVALVMMIVGSAMTSIVKVKRLTPTHGRFSASVAFLQSCPDHWWGEDQDMGARDERPTA